MEGSLSSALLLDRSPKLGGYLIASAGAHGALLLIGFALSYLSLRPAIDLGQKPIHASLVRLGTPRDERLLPRKEEPPPPPVPAPIPQAPPSPLPSPAAVALPGIKPTPHHLPGHHAAADADRRRKLFGAFERFSKSTRAEELNGQLDGDANGDAANAEGERYWGMLSAQIHRNYDVSQTIPDQERIRLKARVLLQLGKKGEVLKVALAAPSGNALFDAAVLAAVKRASPFPPPPENLRATLQSSGVVLEFHP